MILLKDQNCPYCGASMRPVVLGCDQCETEVRGRFRQTQFQRLSATEAAFLEEYLLAGFSIKALAEQSGIGYTAIRSRLDRIIATYQRLHTNDLAKREILERLERGELDAGHDCGDSRLHK